MAEPGDARENTAGGEEGAIPQQLVRLLEIPQELRKAEDVFEIANGLYRASFVRQLDIATRYVSGCPEILNILIGFYHATGPPVF